MDDTKDILDALDDKKPEKKPTNWELWSALYFAEAVFVVLDAGSALSVYLITGYWYYAVIVFLAGVVPLYLYTKQYTRPLASIEQRQTSFWGGVVAISSVIIVAVFMAVLNFYAQVNGESAVMWTEAGLAVSLVLVLASHGFIMAKYFFADEEIKEGQRTNRIIARGGHTVRRIQAARKVADSKRQEVNLKKDFQREYNPAVLAKILRMMEDLDEDGIPDVIDPVDDRTGKPFNSQQLQRPAMPAMAQEVKQVKENFTKGREQ